MGKFVEYSLIIHVPAASSNVNLCPRSFITSLEWRSTVDSAESNGNQLRNYANLWKLKPEASSKIKAN